MNKLRILMILLLVGMLVTGTMLAYYAKGYYDDRKDGDNLREIAYSKTQSTEAAGDTDGDIGSEDPGKEEEAVTIDFAALKEINPDIVGWLWACGGAIDGPIVRTEDNTFYLDHRFDKSAGSVGCFFADADLEEPFVSPLTVVYGHNRKDGSMFHPLLNYKDSAYFDNNDTFSVYTEEGELTYRIFSAFYADNGDIYGEAYKQAAENGNDPELINKLYEEARGRSLYEPAGHCEPGSIVILSTCEYSGDNNRMVIYGVLTESEDTAE